QAGLTPRARRPRSLPRRNSGLPEFRINSAQVGQARLAAGEGGEGGSPTRMSKRLPPLSLPPQPAGPSPISERRRRPAHLIRRAEKFFRKNTSDLQGKSAPITRQGFARA